MQPFFSVARFDRLLESADMEAMLFCRPASFLYFTTLPWYERVHFSDMPGQYVVPIAGYVRGRPDQAFSTASAQMDFPDFKARNIWIPDVRPTMGAASYERQAEHIIRVLREKGVQSGQVGIERGTLSHDLVAALDALAPDIRWTESREILFKLQELKSNEELDRLRAACRITEKGMMRVFDRLSADVTPEELMDVYVRSTAGLYAERFGHFFSVHFKDFPLYRPRVEGSSPEAGDTHSYRRVNCLQGTHLGYREEFLFRRFGAAGSGAVQSGLHKNNAGRFRPFETRNLLRRGGQLVERRPF